MSNIDKILKRYHLTREGFDEILYESMIAIYQFDRMKVMLFGMTYQDSYLLYFIRKRGSAGIGEIAEELNIHISTASRAVDKLENRKLVNRKKDRGDRRNILVSLTKEGAMLMKASEDHSFYSIRKGLEKFTDEEILNIIKGARKLNRILGIPHTAGRKREK